MGDADMVKSILFLTIILTWTLTVFGCSQVSAGSGGPGSSSSSSSSVYSSGPQAVTNYTDSAYIITYSQTKFVPPDGKFLLIGGQDRAQISQFVPAWGVTPGGFASYIAVSSTNGIWNNDASGGDPNIIENSKWLADTYTNSVLQIAMWMVGPTKSGGIDYCSNTINGQYNYVLDSFCTFAQVYNRPIFLRIGYEFDGPHNALEPASYVACFRYIVDYIRANNVTNVAFVWHSYAAPAYNNYPITNWYPGDSYVDWFAATVFGQVYNGSYSSDLNNFVDLSRQHSKPFMIAESCPIIGAPSGIQSNGCETWNKWFVPYLNFIRMKNIKAFSYINCNMDKTQMFGSFNWHNTRIQDYPVILALWTNEMAKDCYLKESSTLFETLGFTN
jgi:hypothetical protein